MVPPKPVVIPSPVEVRRLAAADVAPPRPMVVRPPAIARPLRRRMLFGLIGVLAVLLIAGAGFGYRWYGQWKARQREAAEQAEREDAPTSPPRP